MREQSLLFNRKGPTTGPNLSLITGPNWSKFKSSDSNLLTGLNSSLLLCSNSNLQQSWQIPLRVVVAGNQKIPSSGYYQRDKGRAKPFLICPNWAKAVVEKIWHACCSGPFVFLKGLKGSLSLDQGMTGNFFKRLKYTHKHVYTHSCICIYTEITLPLLMRCVRRVDDGLHNLMRRCTWSAQAGSFFKLDFIGMFQIYIHQREFIPIMI